jgi:hypothetical protein
VLLYRTNKEEVWRYSAAGFQHRTCWCTQQAYGGGAFWRCGSVNAACQGQCLDPYSKDGSEEDDGGDFWSCALVRAKGTGLCSWLAVGRLGEAPSYGNSYVYEMIYEMDIFRLCLMYLYADCYHVHV